MYHQTPTVKHIDKHGLKRAMQNVTVHGYGCRICDAEVSLEHPRDETGRFWLADTPRQQQRHNKAYHPCLDESDSGHFSKSVPWHPNAPWTSSVSRHGTPANGHYCKMLQCRYALQRFWKSPTEWRLHVWHDHGYHALAHPNKSGKKKGK